MFTSVLPIHFHMYMSHNDTVSGILLVLRHLLRCSFQYAGQT